MLVTPKSLRVDKIIEERRKRTGASISSTSKLHLNNQRSQRYPISNLEIKASPSFSGDIFMTPEHGNGGKLGGATGPGKTHQGSLASINLKLNSQKFLSTTKKPR